MAIRQYQPPTEVFVEEFQESTFPSAIPTSKFINWDKIDRKIATYDEQIKSIAELETNSEGNFKQQLANRLMETDDTRKLIDFCFELVGETGNKYVAVEGLWRFYDIQRAIDDGDREEAEDLVDILCEIGFRRVVKTIENIHDHYHGVLVGMESHARKNRQGTSFEKLVEGQLDEIVDRLNETGYSVEMDDEYTTEYKDQSGQKKTVDFALFEDDNLRLVAEVNAYKTKGSKPSEIRRSYNHVAQRMRNDGVAFVWITDGQAWEKKLTELLRNSYDDITDLYNLHQTETQLPGDVERFFETKAV